MNGMILVTIICVLVAVVVRSGQTSKLSECPSDTVPFFYRQRPKVCSPGQQGNCPSTFVCHNVSANTGICCGKYPGVCPVGQPLIDNRMNRPITCNTARNSSFCGTDFQCTQTSVGRRSVCCPSKPAMTPSVKSSSPIGCPAGTRQLRSAAGSAIPCDVNVPSTCPEYSYCHFNAEDHTSQCCGRDAGDGCPTGTKPLKMNSRKVYCSPFDNNNKCPGRSFCQWSFVTDRYQCCIVDHGCPNGTTSQNDDVCDDVGSTCRSGGTCVHSAWSATSHCCRPLSSCPTQQVPLLDEDTLEPKTCNGGLCPPGYSCHRSSDNSTPVCCATAGVCPANYIWSSDRMSSLFTHPVSCLPSLGWYACADTTSSCMPTIDGPSGQHVCCYKGPQCPDARSRLYLINGTPKRCGLDKAGDCPPGYSCQQPFSQYTPICCSAPPSALARPEPSNSLYPRSLSNLTTSAVLPRCPANHSVSNKNVAITCDPQQPVSCAPGSKCLPSTIPEVFICCTPDTAFSSIQCPSDGVFIWKPLNGPQLCVPNSMFTGCPQTHPLCLFYAPLSNYACCRVPVCPNGQEPFWLLGTTMPQHCGNTTEGACPQGYACLHSPVFNVGVCCLSHQSPRASFEDFRHKLYETQERRYGSSLNWSGTRRRYQPTAKSREINSVHNQ